MKAANVKTNKTLHTAIIGPVNCFNLKRSNFQLKAGRKLLIAVPWNSANKNRNRSAGGLGGGKDTCFNYNAASTNYSITHTYATYGDYNVCVTIKYDVQINRISVPSGYYYVKIWVGSKLQTFKI